MLRSRWKKWLCEFVWCSACVIADCFMWSSVWRGSAWHPAALSGLEIECPLLLSIDDKQTARDWLLHRLFQQQTTDQHRLPTRQVYQNRYQSSGWFFNWTESLDSVSWIGLLYSQQQPAIERHSTSVWLSGFVWGRFTKKRDKKTHQLLTVRMNTRKAHKLWPMCRTNFSTGKHNANWPTISMHL